MTCADLLRRMASGAVLAALLTGCAAAGDRVYVRLRNDGPLPWRAAWLGAGGPNGHLRGFGAVDVGETTPYAALAPVLANYRKTDILIAPGRRYGNVVRPEEHVGTPELAPGRYTFSYRVVGEALVMDIRRDH